MTEHQETMRRALGLAVQILEEMPEELRPVSNIADMRRMMNGESTGRDGPIQMEAIATALAFRTRTAHDAGAFINGEGGFIGLQNRMNEFRDLFALIQLCDPWTLAVKYAEVCGRLGEWRR